MRPCGLGGREEETGTKGISEEERARDEDEDEDEGMEESGGRLG